jgi:hypothetical protein
LAAFLLLFAIPAAAEDPVDEMDRYQAQIDRVNERSGEIYGLVHGRAIVCSKFNAGLKNFEAANRWDIVAAAASEFERIYDDNVRAMAAYRRMDKLEQERLEAAKNEPDKVWLTSDALCHLPNEDFKRWTAEQNDLQEERMWWLKRSLEAAIRMIEESTSE